MTIQPPELPIQPPEGLRAEVLRVAEQLLPSRLADTNTSWALDDDSTAIGVGEVRPLYLIGLDAIAAGRGAEAATQVGWRSIVSIGSRPVAMADAGVEDKPQVQSLNYGPFVAGLSEAAQFRQRRNAAHPDVKEMEAGEGQSTAEERVLVVPALYLTGLWLHDEAEPERDEFIPAAPAPPGVPPNEAIRLADLLEALAETARSRLDDREDADA